MRIVPTLLRVILALSLVLNGTGLAAAHAVDGDTAMAGADVTPMVEVPCHEAPDPSDTGHESHAGEAQVAHTGMNGHQTDTDCCDMGTCENACPQPLSAALMAAGIVGLHAPPASLPQAMAADRPGPLLPHPIRPPIA